METHCDGQTETDSLLQSAICDKALIYNVPSHIMKRRAGEG